MKLGNIISKPANALRGFSRISLMLSLSLEVSASMPWPERLDVTDIPPDISSGGQIFGELPENIQQRIVALLREKFALDFDPSMVEEQWRY